LAFAGFLQFFNADFRGDDCDVILTPNKAFSGNVTQYQATLDASAAMHSPRERNAKQLLRNW